MGSITMAHRLPIWAAAAGVDKYRVEQRTEETAIAPTEVVKEERVAPQEVEGVALREEMLWRNTATAEETLVVVQERNPAKIHRERHLNSALLEEMEGMGDMEAVAAGVVQQVKLPPPLDHSLVQEGAEAMAVMEAEVAEQVGAQAQFRLEAMGAMEASGEVVVDATSSPEGKVTL